MRADNARLLLSSLAAGLVACLVPPAAAQIALDGTTGPAGALSGPDYAIPAELGRRMGGNLFHSFERFSLATGESATFSGPDSIANVIGRVTGEVRSDIDGTLRSTIPGADLWFLNPAGVVFGRNARLDVRGSFHVSTADELRFADNARFGAADPGGSRFTVARPEAFGFLGTEPAGIVVDGGFLHVPAGETVSLAGGDIAIRGTPPDDIFVSELGGIAAPQGRVHLIAPSGPAEVRPADGATAGAVQGDIRLAGFARVAASGDGGGTVRIRAGRFVVDDASSVRADNLGASDGRGAIRVDAAVVEVRGTTSQIRSEAFAEGDAGVITVRAGRLLVSGGTTFISTGTAGSGDAGSVRVRANRIELHDGAGIISNTQSRGDAGEVDVAAARVLVSDGAQISSSTGFPLLPPTLPPPPPLPPSLGGFPPSAPATGAPQPTPPGQIQMGDAGTVKVRAGEIVVRRGGSIRSSSLMAGDGGTVDIEARTILVTGRVAGGTIDSSSSGVGDGGTIRVSADRLAMTDGGRVQSATSGNGAGGEIVITARRDVRISGADAGGSASGIFASSVDAGFGSVFDDTVVPGSGNGGRVEVAAPVVSLTDGGTISVASAGTGVAGAVTIDALDRVVLDQATITAAAPLSDGGRIAVRGGRYVDLHESGMATTIRGAESGAELAIGARVLVLDGSDILLNSTERFPTFGAFTDHLIASPDSRIELNAEPLDLTDLATVLRPEAPPGAFLDASSRLPESCAARRSAHVSSFTATGHGGLPPGPESPLPGFYALGPDNAPTPSTMPGTPSPDRPPSHPPAGAARLTLAVPCGATAPDARPRG